MIYKFCVDCQHYDSSGLSSCRSPKNSIDLVNGKPKSIPIAFARVGGAECGPPGRFFEPKKAVEPKNPWYKFW